VQDICGRHLENRRRGVIDCLDPGGFGAVTITKSIMIDCTHVAGGVLVAGTNGIVINASTTDNVTIRHLYFDGLGSGLSGINILQAGNVHLEDVNIVGFTVAGVSVNASTSVNLSIYDTTITDGISTVGGSITGNGVSASTSSGIVSAVLNNVHVYHTNNGVAAGAGSSFSVTNSDLSFNVIGFSVQVAPGGGDIMNSIVAYNSTAGVQSLTGSTVRVMSSTIRRNGIGLSPNGGNLQSDGLNNANSNSTLGSVTGATIKI
jgi:hypothetical protein